MARTSSARQDAIETAVRLFRTQGYSATGLNQLLEESGAPKGSFYFHFPGGKEQLAMEALHAWGEAIAARMRQRLQESGGDAEKFVRLCFAGVSRELASSAYSGGCVAASLAGELTTDKDALADAVAETLQGWIEIAVEGVMPAMATREQAVTYATSLMMSLSGARTLARAQRSSAVFEATEKFFIASLPKQAKAPAGKAGPST